MNILYISYWGINDPLTISTVYPHLEILNSFENIENIILVTIERNNQNTTNNTLKFNKVNHTPLCSKNFKNNVFNKISDFVYFPSALLKITHQYKINKIIARTSLAGALAFKLSKKTNIPFYVESFEPHADYMIEAGVWKPYSLRAYFQKKWEQKQIKYATAILPVSNNYKKKLMDDGVSESKIFTIPCCVPIEKFRYAVETRNTTRKQLNISNDTIVGIYVGKFGGMYYEDEAFSIFKNSFDYFKNKFYLLIITPNDKKFILEKINTCNITTHNIFVSFVQHHEIPNYLSAADFAYAFYKPNFSAKFLSPIKNGEYWANGLPIFCPDNIGDDSEIIKRENGGAIYSLNETSIIGGLTKINAIINTTNSKKNIAIIAEKHRNFSIVKNIYTTLFRN